MRPLFYFVALATTALAVTACKKRKAPAATEAAAANAAAKPAGRRAPAAPADTSAMSTPVARPARTTTPQGGSPPVSTPAVGLEAA
jgi:hypothetical protein